MALHPIEIWINIKRLSLKKIRGQFFSFFKRSQIKWKSSEKKSSPPSVKLFGMH